MGFYLVGLGLNPPKDITLKGLELIHGAKAVYIETYTNRLTPNVSELAEFFKKDIIPITRAELEETEKLVLEAIKSNVVLLVLGDPLFATTHIELVQRMREKKTKVEIIHNSSVVNAVLDTGLQGYKFGRVVSLPHGSPVKSAYDAIADNKKIGLHTLVLLDVDLSGKGFMTVNDAALLLLKMESEFKKGIISDKEKIIGCSSLGHADSVIKYATPANLCAAKFSEPPHCLVLPGKLHFLEEEALENFS